MFLCLKNKFFEIHFINAIVNIKLLRRLLFLSVNCKVNFTAPYQLKPKKNITDLIRKFFKNYVDIDNRHQTEWSCTLLQDPSTHLTKLEGNV